MSHDDTNEILTLRFAMIFVMLTLMVMAALQDGAGGDGVVALHRRRARGGAGVDGPPGAHGGGAGGVAALPDCVVSQLSVLSSNDYNSI
jgi:GTPase involved in cell partitioning and DNA repair